MLLWFYVGKILHRFFFFFRLYLQLSELTTCCKEVMGADIIISKVYVI